MLILARKWRQTSKCSVLTRNFPACLLQSQLRHCNTSIAATHSWWQPSPSPFFLFFLLVIWGLCFSPSIPKLSAMPVYVSIRIHLSVADPRLSDTILSGAKLVTATLIWKVGASPLLWALKKSPHIIPAQDLPLVTSCADGSILLRKPCKHSHGTLIKHRKGYIKR